MCHIPLEVYTRNCQQQLCWGRGARGLGEGPTLPVYPLETCIVWTMWTTYQFKKLIKILKDIDRERGKREGKKRD